MANCDKEFGGTIYVITEKITHAELRRIAELRFGDLVKAVVDVEKK